MLRIRFCGNVTRMLGWVDDVVVVFPLDDVYSIESSLGLELSLDINKSADTSTEEWSYNGCRLSAWGVVFLPLGVVLSVVMVCVSVGLFLGGLGCVLDCVGCVVVGMVSAVVNSASVPMSCLCFDCGLSGMGILRTTFLFVVCCVFVPFLVGMGGCCGAEVSISSCIFRTSRIICACSVWIRKRSSLLMKSGYCSGNLAIACSVV